MKWLVFTVLVMWMVVTPLLLIYGSPVEYLYGNGSPAVAYAARRYLLGILIIFIGSLILGYRVVWVTILGIFLAGVVTPRLGKWLDK